MGYTEKNYVCACTAGFKGENCEQGTLIPLLSPLLSGHQALDRLFFVSLALFQEYDKGKQSKIEVDDRLWTSNAGAVACFFFFFFFFNKVIFLLKIMLIYDEVI